MDRTTIVLTALTAALGGGRWRRMPSSLRLGLSLLRAPALELGFVLRRCLGWSRGEPVVRDEDKCDLFAALPADRRAVAEQRAAWLLARFDLGALRRQSTAATYESNLARLDALARWTEGVDLPAGPDGVVRAADFGCGDFHYAVALQRWLSRNGGGRRRVVLRGIELDGHGIYRDGHSRLDHARWHARCASDDGSTVRFELGDCTRVRLPAQDLVTLFFPFVSVYASLRWGAPLSRLRPRSLLRRAVATVRPGGWLVVVNQTAAEVERVGRLLRDQPVERLTTASFASELVRHPEPTAGQIGSVWRRFRHADAPTAADGPGCPGTPRAESSPSR